MDYCTLTLEVAEAAAAAEDWYVAVPFPGVWKLDAAYFVPYTTTAADASDWTILRLYDAGGSNSIGNCTTNSGASNGGAFTAGTPVAVALSGDLEFAGSGAEAMKVAKADDGNGAAAEGQFVFAFRKFRAS